jgi:myo-inositol-1(or 4)-monophosphatase
MMPRSSMASMRTEGMAATGGATGGLLEAGWLEACRRMVAAQRELLSAEDTIAARTVYAGRGEGGDETLVIDRAAEDIVFSELDSLHAQGHEFTAVSEERGHVSFGGPSPPPRVVIDPIDGSLNARRTIPSYAFSLAVSSGPAMADVEFAYVYDFGAREEFSARRGEGALLDSAPLRAEGPGYGLEVVGLEAAKPERIIPMLEELAGKAYRIRCVGSIAITLCWVAAGRLDGMLTARACRSVDAAAAQLIAHEAGAVAEFPGFSLAEAPLDLGARYHLTAGLDETMLEALRPVQRRAEPATRP